MAILNAWSRMEVDVMVADGSNVCHYRFMRIMMDYALALQEGAKQGLSDKQVMEMMDINSSDVSGWHIAYPLFGKYLKQLSQQTAFAEQITKDLALNLLGQAALGNKELTNQQLGAIKLIMQSNDQLSKGPKPKEEKKAITNFQLQEKGDAK